MKTNEDEFTAHGIYTRSNSCGYLVELSDCGEGARLSIDGSVTEWLEIEYVVDKGGDSTPFIDPNGYNVPLTMVMRIRGQ